MPRIFLLILGVLLSASICLAQGGDSSNTRIVYQHENDAVAVTFSSDGSFLAAVVEESQRASITWYIRIWDMNTMQIVRSYERHLASGVAFSPNDSLIAFEYDRKVAVHDWRSNSETPIAEFRVFPVIWHVEFSNDGKYLLGSNARPDATVYVWDTATWTELRQINVGAELPVGGIHGEAFTISPDGRYFASATDGSTLPIYEIETGNLVCSVALPVKDNSSRGTYTTSVDYSPDGTQIVIVTGDIPDGALDFDYDWIRFIDVNACIVIAEIEYPVERVHLSRVRFIDSDRIIVGSSTSSARTRTESITIWDIHERKIIERLDHPETRWIEDLDVSSDSRHFASVVTRNDPGLAVWEIPLIVRASTSEIPTTTKFTISNYPNPVVDWTTFVIDAPPSAKASLQVFDPLGREVLSRPETLITSFQQEMRIDNISLAAGVYIYQITVRSPEKPLIYRGQLVKQ